MAVVPYSPENVEGNGRVLTWAHMKNGDTGQPFPCSQFSTCSIHVYAENWGAGGNCRIQGTNETAPEPKKWVALSDFEGDTLEFTSSALRQVREAAYQLRPKIIAGDINTDITVVAMFMGSVNRWKRQD